MSKPLLTTLAAACVLALPALAHSRQVTLSAQLKNYSGNGAYVAAYLTDAKGAYAGTLWVAGGKAKYYKHLADWNRLSARDPKRRPGVTGASVGAGVSASCTTWVNSWVCAKGAAASSAGVGTRLAMPHQAATACTAWAVAAVFSADWAMALGTSPRL